MGVMRLLVTYSEPHSEEPAKILFDNLREESELENIYFWEPDIIFEEFYQTLLCKMLKELGYIDVRKTFLKDYEEKDWKHLKEEWDRMWNEVFGEREYIIVGEFMEGGKIEFFSKNKREEEFFEIVEHAQAYARDFWRNEILQAMLEENCERALELHCGIRWHLLKVIDRICGFKKYRSKSELYIPIKAQEEVDETIRKAFKRKFKANVKKSWYKEPVYGLEMYFWASRDSKHIFPMVKPSESWFLPRTAQLPGELREYAVLPKYESRILTEEKSNKELLKKYQKRLKETLEYLDEKLNSYNSRAKLLHESNKIS